MRALRGVPTVATLKRRRGTSISRDVVSLAVSERPQTHRVAALVAGISVVLGTTQLKFDPSLGGGCSTRGKLTCTACVVF